MNFTETLANEKRRFLIRANGGIALPAAGAIYWLGLGIAGFYLRPGSWIFLAYFTSGLIFPLGLLLQKPLKANLLVTNPLTSLIGPALVSMMLSWPVTIAAAQADKSVVPMALAIGMSLHWPIFSWIYGSRTCFAHAIVRVIGVTLCWFLMPDDRFTAIPLLVATLYLLTIWGLKLEISSALKKS